MIPTAQTTFSEKEYHEGSACHWKLEPALLSSLNSELGEWHTPPQDIGDLLKSIFILHTDH